MSTVTVMETKQKQRLLVTELLQSVTLTAGGSRRLTGHSQSACKDFRAHSNFIHLDSAILKDIFSIRETALLLSLADKTGHESQAML